MKQLKPVTFVAAISGLVLFMAVFVKRTGAKKQEERITAAIANLTA